MTKLITLCTMFFLALSCQAQDSTWYFVRHFEKQTGDDPHLNELGQQNAQSLVTALKGKKLNKIYSTQYNRTLESATPLATERGLEIIIYDPAKLAFFAEQIKAENHILIVGHSNTTPQLIRLMGMETADLTEEDYGQLFTLTNEQKQLNLLIQNLRAN
ncbi:histidine phosphatase family protein [Paraglaciecola hydrolytica]|uniref:Histidine phosphatase family protein n=1 Tax=Paraglaciecola hydrolytica TaxID=1799789 RepID=A0A136A3R1_9ALTE|nr:histidine phosphatase family protein [Paraglaciecola hydrolytica]KXI29847.1 hypothetical protein AX660_07395 [Paraglaciecola hydrolytica]